MKIAPSCTMYILHSTSYNVRPSLYIIRSLPLINIYYYRRLVLGIFKRIK